MKDAQTALLSAKGLSKSFGALRVLHKVDFDVRPGEVLGILGPNGAGKTTLFNLISGDLRSDSGSLTFGDVTLKAQPPFRRCQLGIGRTYQIPEALQRDDHLRKPAGRRQFRRPAVGS